MVIIPLRTGHHDPKIFGERIDDFVPDRFLKDVIKTSDPTNGHAADDDSVGKRDPSVKAMRPFGGGITLCPGRFFARNEALAFVATTLRKFDIQLMEDQKEAKPLTTYPVAGIYPPDREVSVRVRLRK
jgi:cytochrome P450